MPATQERTKARATLAFSFKCVFLPVFFFSTADKTASICSILGINLQIDAYEKNATCTSS